MAQPLNMINRKIKIQKHMFTFFTPAIKKISYTALGCLAWASVQAQPMNLEACITYSLEHNLDIQAQHQAQAISKENYKQAKRNFLPSFEAGSSANSYFGKSINPTTNDFVDQRLFSTHFSLQSELLLFQGLMHHHQKNFEYYNMQATEAENTKGIKAIKYATMQAYYQVVYKQRLVEICRAQLSISELQLKKMQKMIVLGLKPEADIFEIKALVAKDRYLLSSAEGEAATAMAHLRQQLNYPPQQILEIESNTPANKLLKAKNTDSLYHAALANAPEIAIAEAQKEAAHKALAIQKARLYPSLYLGASYSSRYANSQKERINPNDPNDLSLRTIPFQQQLKQNASQNIYLSLRIPLFNRWNQQSNIKIAKHHLQASEIARQKSKTELYQNITSNVEQLKAYIKQWEQLLLKVQVDKNALAIAEKKWQQGINSWIEYSIAKNTLAQTQVDVLRTQTQAKVLAYGLELLCTKE